MADIVDIVPPFLKNLTEKQKSDIINDIDDLINNYYNPGMQKLIDVINRSNDTDLKNKFNDLFYKGNGLFYYYDSLESGYGTVISSLIKVKDSTTKDKIKEIYNEYFIHLRNAGSGNSRKNKSTPEYPVTLPKDGKLILLVDSGGLTSIQSYSQIYDTFGIQDSYAAKAVSDYMFRVLLRKESFTQNDAIKYYTSFTEAVSQLNALTYLYRYTLAGTVAALKAIKEKLNNYKIGSEDFTSSPTADLEDNSNTSFFASQFDNILQQWNVGFNIYEYLQLKVPESTFKDPNKLDEIKKGFYKVFTPSNLASLPTNEKYGKSIWDRIQTSGLLDLALSVNSIGEFAQTRFSAGQNLTDPAKGSAANAINPIRDTMWLNDLSRVMTNLTRDPITLAIIQQYFPNLVTLFFNAAAAAADYSGGSASDPINNLDEMAKSLLASFGTDKDGKPIFEAAWDFINTGQRIKAALDKFPFRENIPPRTPDIFHFRLGAANFYVPPVSININSQFKTGSLTSGALRQKSSPKFNAGYKETTINMKLFFPNYEEIWGISIDGIQDFKLDKDYKIDFKAAGNEDKIDKFLSSLRGLIAAFKYAPIIPVKNHYLNTVHGITGVALSSMSISTIPNYPFAVVVDLEMLSFNHKPFLPMIKDFNQAVHWGKFRHYMGKAAGSLHSYINESFFLGTKEENVTLGGDRGYEVIQQKTSASTTGISNVDQITDKSGTYLVQEQDLLTDPFKEDIFKTNIIKEWRNGNNISLFIPQQTQTKIFSPDTSSFRGEEEKSFKDVGEAGWEALLKNIGIDINQSNSYHRNLDSVKLTSLDGSISPSARRIVLESIDLIVAGANRKDFQEKVYEYFAKAFILENSSKLDDEKRQYILQSPTNPPTENYTDTTITYQYQKIDLQRPVKTGQSGGESSLNYSLKDVRDLLTKASSNAEAALENLSRQDAAEKANTSGKNIDDYIDQSREDIGKAFNVLVYNRFFKSGPIQSIMQKLRLANSYKDPESGKFGNGISTFNEWEVPMMKVDIDPKSVIVNGVSVTLGNNLAKLQLQMQDEPTYQHIGGRDTFMNISMTVFGEKELIKLRKVFEHINGLARLEHATGVIGFMGIKNIIAGLAGMKYVMPLSYQVDTIPNYPHVYDVRISFVDFDIFQQQREQLSSKQQEQMIKTFGTKKNPFLRMKQLWGSFNCYPDFPLMVKDENGEVVGSLDPDYYFRGFEMLDDDVVYHLSSEEKKMADFNIPAKQTDATQNTDVAKYNNRIINDIKTFITNNKVKDLKDYFVKENITLQEASGFVQAGINEFLKGQNSKLLIDFIHQYEDSDQSLAVFTSDKGIGSDAVNYNTKVGDVSYSEQNAMKEIQSLIGSSNFQVTDERFISIDPDELTIHHSIVLIPASENQSDDKMPAILFHSQGYHLGYLGKNDNRFYFTTNGVELKKANPDDPNDGTLSYVPVHVPYGDADSPSKSYSATDGNGKEAGAAHVAALGGLGANLARTHDPYSKASVDSPEVSASSLTEGSVAKHWERMLIDTKYRDISGRMIRAFPTYMLWLIDEGGYFSGVKMFDNFYGLQSIIDFSIVQSEDILGDTLILRLSNLYSKLTTPESSSMFRVDEEYNQEQLTLTDGISSVLDKALNRARNMQAHMENDYIVNVNSIRIKPGVRVHLRGGYGSNPNGLQTLFNGIITQVENGEIVTITAQSDAIELSPIVNSTNKKGDSGHIDGGINTGFWLSEPRDLMVRLLSMGSSRTREAIAHATRGLIFSENKFGIRHFGQILYAPLTEEERVKNEALISAVKDAFNSIAEDPGAAVGTVLKTVGGTIGGGIVGSMIPVPGATMAGAGLGFGLGSGVRGEAFSLMQTLWANFSAQRDFEIFKRNIYPGNGTGIAQFLGGDLGDGWSTVASITPSDQTNERLNYIGRVTDLSWNKLTSYAGSGISPGNADAKQIIDVNTAGNAVRNSNGSAGVGKALIGGALAAAGVAVTGGLGAPIIGGILTGGGLLGALSGRSGTNIFNALGITSGMDDDLPGLDEVSFRAQTYMRSVWDLFQTCARLLPNYIVAIRPFEDRSTVFYGKPHWLYTSGVVPLTTGFPGKKLAEEMGIKSPNPIDVDTIFTDTMNQINKVSNPLADAQAFGGSNSIVRTVDQSVSEILNPGLDSVYLPSSFSDVNIPGNFRGKVIPFGYKSTMEYRGVDGNPISRLPESFGYATIGYHLPIGENLVEAELNDDLLSSHKQIDMLPPRYRFPFFTDRKDSVTLEDFAYYALADQLGTWRNHKADYMTLATDKWSYGGGGGNKAETEWVKLLKQEKNITVGKRTTDNTILQNKNGRTIAINLKIGDIPSFGSIDLGDSYIYQERAVSGSSKIIRMPLPDIGSSIKDETKAKEYEIYRQNPSLYTNVAALQEWTAPTDPKAEQFYIAMRWPYIPSSNFNSTSVEQFQQNYGIQNSVGKVEDYKKRRIMVYSPSTGKAVVCQPAYFLWGQDTVRVSKPSIDGNKQKAGNQTYDEFGNPLEIEVDGGSTYGVGGSNTWALEKDEHLSAIVSPDAAYFLGMMNLTPTEQAFWSDGSHSKSEDEWYNAEDAIKGLAEAGIAPFPVPRKCYYAFVPDDTPLGVVPDLTLPTEEFKSPNSSEIQEAGNGSVIVGFGLFKKGSGIIIDESYSPSKSSDSSYFQLKLDSTSSVQDVLAAVGRLELGGNIFSGEGTDAQAYFDLVKNKSQINQLSEDSLREVLSNEKKGRESFDGKRFAEVYNELDRISVEARSYYDQDFDPEVNVIAGNGRTLREAQDIWDQFRFGYHNYKNVKEIFQQAYGLDPNSDEDLAVFYNLNYTETSSANFRKIESASTSADSMQAAFAQIKQNNNVFKKYSDSNSTAEDEFTTIFGDSFLKNPGWIGQENGLVQANLSNSYLAKVRQGIETSRQSFIDAGPENNGLIDYFNTLFATRIEKLRSIMGSALEQSGITEENKKSEYINSITTPKQLFLFMVGAFRNAMWKDPYARAWLVLKPNKKLTFDKDDWDFSPVLKVFQAFIDPNEDFAKKPDKFKKLLAQNASEGSGSSTIWGKAAEDVKGFWDNNIGPLFTALGDSLSGLVNLFRMSMMQMGYGLSQIGQMSKQANILNKVLNDSIYYSLGRPGSLLRAVDNPFTREYGEPVVEIRQPFQRMHYLSSFSHIISNGITENINGVATSVTAVSDGKYPVTVAMDKSMPAERQVEKTVETGLYFDNVTGSGLFGALQPVLHPFEFARGISKFAQGTPDELLARRVALAHLKESLKDIYTGEILIIGNPDIRPHDLIYLADVYERMYGMFEVEQVVHHFTSELGFVTSITPNALVTVNDPAKWFMSSWIGTWFHMQALRNDTRMYMSSLGSGINNMGRISVEGLSDSLQAQMVGGIQYTHGASAITKDIMAHFTSEGVNDLNSQVKGLVAASAANKTGQAGIGISGVAALYAGGALVGGAATALAATAIPGAGALLLGGAGILGGGLGGSTIWKGWSWIRDNILDQHGCYIQYLNRNGKPMDAGLNQSGTGMVVGRYHTKRLLPGILGVSTKVRTDDGYSYIRTDDLLKNLGWKEKEINDLVRYIDLENAMVNSQVLRYSGIGPEKTGLGRNFKIICEVKEITDGDTIKVVDIFDSAKKEFTIRFDGINTPELNVIKSNIDVNGKVANIQYLKIEDDPSLIENVATFTTSNAHEYKVNDVVLIKMDNSNYSIMDTYNVIKSVTENTFSISTPLPPVSNTATSGTAITYHNQASGDYYNANSPGGKAKAFVQSALKNKLIILRVNPNKNDPTLMLDNSSFEPGSVNNNPKYYEQDIYSRVLGVIFYKTPQAILDNIVIDANDFITKYKQASNSEIKEKMKNRFDSVTPFYNRFNDIYDYVSNITKEDYAKKYGSSSVNQLSEKYKTIYNIYVYIKILESIYNKASEWPNAEWDETYDDGTPISLNYELVTNGLAKVYTEGLLIEQPAVISAAENAANLIKVSIGEA